jgi:hypothetical protein
VDAADVRLYFIFVLGVAGGEKAGVLRVLPRL